MKSNGDGLIEIANGRRVSRGTICYHIRGGNNFPLLERLRLQSEGFEAIVTFPDNPHASAQKIARAEIFETPAEAVEARCQNIERQAQAAIARTRALLR